MSSLSEQIFAADDIESKVVEVKQWGVSLVVKSMTARDRSKMLASAAENGGNIDLSNVLPEIVILCTYDPETGEKVFSDSDRDALLAKSAAAIEQIATVAMELSGLSDGANDVAGKDS